MISSDPNEIAEMLISFAEAAIKGELQNLSLGYCSHERDMRRTDTGVWIVTLKGVAKKGATDTNQKRLGQASAPEPNENENDFSGSLF